ncbi:unnamed protein product [Rotaria sp. Silwood1]|nr:unnamed protein product [Rotaria sp. Silwood1]
MIKHIKSCQTTSKDIPNASLTIKEYLRPKTAQPISRIFKEKITDATVEFVAVDNRAFELVSGDGFINLAQTIFNVGQDLSKTPDVNVLDLIPNPRTVSVSFCGIALFYLNDELKLHVFILGCFPYDRDNQTASQIRQFVDNVIDKVPVKCEIAQEMFVHVRKIVSHTRRTHKQTKLSRKLQSYCDTRFNGAFLMMDVLLLVFDELPGVLERALMNDYESIDKDLLSCICLFLKPFEEVIEQFSSDTKPTIYKVLPFKQYLLNHCKIHPDDHDGIQQVKTFLEKRIQDVWIIHDIHYITTFLHPSFKNFDKCSDFRAKAIDLTKNELMKRQPSSSIICSTNNKSPARIVELDPQTSSPKTLLSQCFDTPKNDLKLPTTPYDELEEYIALNVRLSENDDILLFWLNHKMKFPTLFNIFQDFYAIPASNTTIERVFSSSKNTITDKRTRLDTKEFSGYHAAERIVERLNEICNDWSIGDKIVCLVSDNCNTIKKVGKDFQKGWIGCTDHLINLIASDVRNLDDVRNMLATTRYIISFTRDNHLAKEILNKYQRSLGLAERQLIFDVITRWNSTFYILQRFLEEKVSVAACLNEKLFQKHFSNSKISKVIEWDFLKQLLNVLKPFEAATRKLASDSLPTLSIVLPVITTLITSLEKRTSDCSFLKKIKDTLPLAFEAKKLAYSLLQEEFNYLSRGTTVTSPSNLFDRSKEKEIDIFDIMITNNCLSSSNTYDSELLVYESESELHRNENPLEWWSSNKQKYPILSQLAYKYLCIIAISVPSERMFSTTDIYGSIYIFFCIID